jgi:uncharacterized protein YerC
MLLALFRLAAAADPAAPAEAPAPAAEVVPGREPRAVIEDAILVRKRGDLAGARALLVQLEPMIGPADLSWYLYQRGICEELDFRPADAKAFYDKVVEMGEAEALDARFRRALVLEDMGEDAAALEDVLAIAKVKGLDERDRVTLALQQGVAEVHTGKTRKGIRHIQKALADVEGGPTHTWMRAKARYTLAKALLDEADALSLDVPEKKQVKHLEQRAVRMKAAEDQVIALVALKEPEWILASLIALGDSYAKLGDDLAAAPPPARLSPEQVEVYRAEVAKKVANVRGKAWHAYDQGVALATRLEWESPRVAELKERRAKLGGG